MLDATAELNDWGQLVVTGTDAGESIDVSLSDDEKSVEVTVDGTVIGTEPVDDVHGVFIDGGAGNDTITSNAAESHLFGDAGDDTLTGSAGSDTI